MWPSETIISSRATLHTFTVVAHNIMWYARVYTTAEKSNRHASSSSPSRCVGPVRVYTEVRMRRSPEGIVFRESGLTAILLFIIYLHTCIHHTHARPDLQQKLSRARIYIISYNILAHTLIASAAENLQHKLTHVHVIMCIIRAFVSCHVV